PRVEPEKVGRSVADVNDRLAPHLVDEVPRVICDDEHLLPDRVRHGPAVVLGHPSAVDEQLPVTDVHEPEPTGSKGNMSGIAAARSASAAVLRLPPTNRGARDSCDADDPVQSAPGCLAVAEVLGGVDGHDDFLRCWSSCG